MTRHAEPHQKVNLDDLNELAAALGSPRRHWFTCDSWNQLVDHVNEHGATPRIPRHRRGAVLTSDQWNALVDHANTRQENTR